MDKIKLRAMLLLCALIVGSLSVGAAETTVELTATNLGLLSSGYNETTVTLDKFNFKYFDLMKDANDNIRFRASTGYIFNSTPFPENIKSVIITHVYTGRSTIIQGSTDGENWSDVATGTGSLNADFTSYSYKYFKIKNNDASNSHWSKIEITYGNATPSSAVSFADKTPSIEYPGTTTYSQIPTTATGYMDETGAAITYEMTANTAGATINASTGLVTVAHEGSVTVKATAAAIEGTFLSSNDSYTLTVTDNRTDAPISFSSATAEATMGEDFDAPVLNNENGLNVTYSSSNEAVATVNTTTGAVTLVASGTTNIIATFTGDATYKYTTAQYELTVNGGPQALPYEESFLGSFGKFTSDEVEVDGINVWFNHSNYARATSAVGSKLYNGESWLTSPTIDARNVTHFALSFEHSINDSFGTIEDEAMVYAKKIDDADWTKLLINDFPSASSGSSPVFLATTVDLSAFAGNKMQIAFVYKGSTTNAGQWRVKNVKVAVSAEDITVSDAGLATYASDYDMDFTDVTGLEAYIAMENGEKIELHQVRKVPAGSGVLLRVTNGEKNFVVPVVTTTDDVTGNIFVRGTGDAVETGTGPYNWILSKKNGVIGFYYANGNNVAKNRAYLQTSVASARVDLSFEEEEPTGVKDVRNQKAEGYEVYDLQGRKVTNPTKGLYIVNGRKITIK